MKWQKFFLAFAIFGILFMIYSCKPEVYYGDHPLPWHPRLLLLKGEEKDLLQSVSSDSQWNKIHMIILDESDSIINKPLLERIKTGKRLLSVSRECLRRVYFLSYSYRMTAEKRYLERAENEMLKVASFTDWNPSHFLDVAEMTAGLAIGYDWLYKELPKASKDSIKNAIITKGLEPSLLEENSSWAKTLHNWNQVCNAGMLCGALAVYEDQPELAKQIIDRALETITMPMKEYGPDGAYPEGYSYWGYGTSFNILFLSALEKAMNTDFGLTSMPGFMQTAGFLKNMVGPTAIPFNFSDCSPGGSLNPAVFWFARQLNDHSLLQNEIKFLSDIHELKSERFLPSMMIWGSRFDLSDIQIKEELSWVGHGKTPVALMRSSQTDPAAIFVGFKGGTPSSNHSHMDIGSFVMDAGGERWAMDFGMQDYYSLESKNVNLWSMAQNSQRWEVYRYNNFAHNVLTINNEYQKVSGYADITSYTKDPQFLSARADLSQVYGDAVTSVVRGIAIAEKKFVTVRDEIVAGDKAIRVRWNLLTGANVQILDKRTAELSKNGKKLRLVVAEPSGAVLKTWSTEPTHDYDAPNPGTIFVGFEINIPGGASQAITVLLIPEGSGITEIPGIQPLDKWK